MNKNKIVISLYTLISIFVLTSLFVCAFYFPYQAGLFHQNQTSLTIVEFIFYEISSLFVFVFLFMGFFFTTSFKTNPYSAELFKKLFYSGLFLCLGCFAFAISNIVFAIIKGKIDYEVYYSLFGLIGLSISIVIMIVSSCLKETALLKKENEEFI